MKGQTPEQILQKRKIPDQEKFLKDKLGGSAFELLIIWTIDHLNYWSFELLFILTTDNDVISFSSNNTLFINLNY